MIGFIKDCKCCNQTLFLPFVFMFDREALCHKCFWWAWRILEEGNLD